MYEFQNVDVSHLLNGTPGNDHHNFEVKHPTYPLPTNNLLTRDNRNIVI